MTASPGARPSYRRIAWMVLRVVVSAAVLVTFYYLLPLDHASTPAEVTILVIGLAAFIALVAVQVRLIIRHPYPALRAVESLATSVPLFLLLFAAAYVVLAQLSVNNFGEHLSHTDGLYFAVTIFSTVGFGDITAKTETARLVVTGQMIADLIILGLAIKVIVGAVRRGQQRQRASDDQASAASQAGRQADTLMTGHDGHVQAGWGAGCDVLAVRLASRPARNMTSTPIATPHNVHSTR